MLIIPFPPQALDTELSLQVKKVLEEAASQKGNSFSDCFSHSADFSKLKCKAHEAAESGEKGLTEFPSVVSELGRTGTLRNLYLFRNNLETLPAELSTSFPDLKQLMIGYNKLTTLPSLAGFR